MELQNQQKKPAWVLFLLCYFLGFALLLSGIANTEQVGINQSTENNLV